MTRPGERPDDRPVDPDELQVAADLQLDAPRRLRAVPASTVSVISGRELAAVVGGDVRGEVLEPAVDLGLQVGRRRPAARRTPRTARLTRMRSSPRGSSTASSTTGAPSRRPRRRPAAPAGARAARALSLFGPALRLGVVLQVRPRTTRGNGPATRAAGGRGRRGPRRTTRSTSACTRSAMRSSTNRGDHAGACRATASTTASLLSTSQLCALAER